MSVSGPLHQEPVEPCARSLYEDLLCKMPVPRVLAPRSCNTTCARSLSAGLLCKISLYQDVCVNISSVGLLVQIFWMRIPCAYLCARVSASRSSMTCLWPPVQGLGLRISCPRSLCQDVCIRILQKTLWGISVCGSLSKIFSEDPEVKPLAQDLCMRISLAQDLRVRIFASRPSKTSCARSLYEDLAALPAFRAMDTHDLRRGLHLEIKQRSFACITRTRHARSPHNGSHFKAMFQKHCACHEIMNRSHTKCSNGHAKASSSSSSKNATTLRNWATWPQNIGSGSIMVRIPCARHVKCNPSNDTRLPTVWQCARNAAPATIFTTCRIPFACHVNSRFWPSHVTDSLHLPWKRNSCPKTCTDTGKTMHSKLRFPRRQLCGCLRSRNQHRISKRHSCANETSGTPRAPQWAPGLYPYRKNPSE